MVKPRLRLILNVFSFLVRAQIGRVAIGISCGRLEVGDFFRLPIDHVFLHAVWIVQRSTLVQR